CETRCGGGGGGSDGRRAKRAFNQRHSPGPREAAAPSREWATIARSADRARFEGTAAWRAAKCATLRPRERSCRMRYAIVLATLAVGCGNPSMNPTATTCAAIHAECGDAPDGAGGTLHCGSCTGAGTSATCVANHCRCTPATCDSAGKTCGMLADGCGGTLDCGGCTAPETCGGAGIPNACGCGGTLDCAAVGANCGTISDACGNMVDCGSCAAPLTCAGGGTPNVCGCVPTTCAAQAKDCGFIS